MSEQVSIQDVATAAGVDKSTVSRVLNGKAERGRIRTDTQTRIRSIARQLGYKPNPNTRFAAGKHLSAPTVVQPSGIVIASSPSEKKQIGLVLSLNSPAGSLALIPGLEPILATADFKLVVMTLPVDPIAARGRIVGLLQDSAGVLCCPSIYQAVAEVAGTQKPVIVLWQGAAQAILGRVGGEPVAATAPTRPATPIPAPAVEPTPTPAPTPSPAPATSPYPAPAVSQAPGPAPAPAQAHMPAQAPTPAPTPMPTPVPGLTPAPTPAVVPLPVVSEPPPDNPTPAPTVITPEPVPEPEPLVTPPAVQHDETPPVVLEAIPEEPEPTPAVIETAPIEVSTQEPVEQPVVPTQNANEAPELPQSSQDAEISAAPSVEAQVVATPEPAPEPPLAVTPTVVQQEVPVPAVVPEAMPVEPEPLQEVITPVPVVVPQPEPAAPTPPQPREEPVAAPAIEAQAVVAPEPALEPVPVAPEVVPSEPEPVELEPAPTVIESVPTEPPVATPIENPEAPAPSAQPAL